MIKHVWQELKDAIVNNGLDDYFSNVRIFNHAGVELSHGDEVISIDVKLEDNTLVFECTHDPNVEDLSDEEPIEEITVTNIQGVLNFIRRHHKDPVQEQAAE